MAEFSREVPLKAVQIEALVVMKITRHCARSFPTTATGFTVGMDEGGLLQVTNAYSFPTVELPPSDGHHDNSAAAANLAAAAPRAKANIAYQTEMIRNLKEANVDANNVGWYTSANMGSFVNLNFIENQFLYQRDLNERTVALVYDISRSSQGSLSLRAFRLSTAFMASYRENKFTTEVLQKSGLRYQDILIELPVQIHNSHLLTSFLHQLPAKPPTAEIPFPSSLKEVASQNSGTFAPPLYPNFDALDLSVDPYLEKTCDNLLDSIELHNSKLNDYQYWQRQMAREQNKIAAWQAKRKLENQTRTLAKQPLLPEDEWQRMFKLPTEPSRLDLLLNSRQVEQYARQLDGYTAEVSTKMFAVKENLLPSEANEA